MSHRPPLAALALFFPRSLAAGRVVQTATQALLVFLSGPSELATPRVFVSWRFGLKAAGRSDSDLHREPSLSGNDQRFYAGLQSRMNYRCEARVVIGRDLGHCA